MMITFYKSKRDFFTLPLTVIMAGSLFSFYVNADGTKFLDLSGSKYKGPDHLLEAFDINNMALRHSDPVLNPHGNLRIVWDTTITLPRKKTLESYSLSFDVYDRRGKQVFSGTKTWERAVVGKEVINIPVKNLKYGTVKYWITNIDVSNASATKKAKKEAEARQKQINARAKTSRKQTGLCNLELPAFCTDYSKNIEYGPIQIGKKVDIEAYAKKHGLIVGNLVEKTEIRYFLYRNMHAKRNGSALINVYTTPDKVVKYLSWYGGKWGLPIHINGMKAYIRSTGWDVPLDNSSFIQLGPGPSLILQSNIMGVVSVKASVGVRPMEISRTKPERFTVYRKPGKSKIFFESGVACKKYHKADCDSKTATRSELKGKLKFMSKSKDRSYTYQYRIGRGPVVQIFATISMEGCNRQRDYALHTDLQWGYQQQSECYVWKSLRGQI